VTDLEALTDPDGVTDFRAAAVVVVNATAVVARLNLVLPDADFPTTTTENRAVPKTRAPGGSTEQGQRGPKLRSRPTEKTILADVCQSSS